MVKKTIRNVIALFVFDFYRCVSLHAFNVSYTDNVGVKKTKKKQSGELHLVSICLRNFLPLPTLLGHMFLRLPQ